MTIRFYLFLMGMALLSSCSHQKQPVSVRYSSSFVKDTAVVLLPKPLPVDMEYITDMKYVKNHIILRSGARDAEYRYQIFRLSPFELAAQLPEDKRMDCLAYGQHGLLGYDYYAPDSLYKVDWRNDTLCVEGMSVLPRLPEMSLLVQQDEHVLLCNTPIKGGGLREIYRLDLRTGAKSSFGFYPEDNSRFKTMERYQWAYRHGIAVKPDGTQLLSYYLFLRRFRIYDMGGELLQDVSIDYAPFEYVVHASHNKYFYISGAWTTNNRIYLLCVDRDMNVEDPPGESSLIVADWEGNLLVRYRMDRYITSFFIDEQEKTFYGTSPLNGRHVFCFQL